MLVLAGALGWALTWRVHEMFLYSAARTAHTIASTAILSQLSSDAFGSELGADDAARIDELLDRDLRPADIFAIKLWGPRGVLIYSSDPGDPIGTSFADHDEVAAALQGEVIAEIKREARAENERQFAYSGPLLEVYAPVQDPVTGEVLGIFETYQPYAPIQTEIQFAATLIWTFLLIGTGTAYVIQLGMVRSMAHDLDKTEAKVFEVNARLESSLAQIEEHSLGTLQALNAAVDAKDSYTASHCLGVTDYVVAMAAQLKLSKDDVELLERAALLHDIGKIGVPESILLKPARLTTEEFAVVKQHSASGGEIIESIPFLQNLVPLVRHHHEHWDGTGYPDGLAGQRIPRLARILSVADAFEAMTSDRPYRVAMSTEQARTELLCCRGIQFDPEAVDALLVALDSRTDTVVRGGGYKRRSGNISA